MQIKFDHYILDILLNVGSKYKIKCYIFGGYIRDVLNGEAVSDIDIVIYNDIYEEKLEDCVVNDIVKLLGDKFKYKYANSSCWYSGHTIQLKESEEIQKIDITTDLRIVDFYANSLCFDIFESNENMFTVFSMKWIAYLNDPIKHTNKEDEKYLIKFYNKDIIESYTADNPDSNPESWMELDLNYRFTGKSDYEYEKFYKKATEIALNDVKSKNLTVFFEISDVIQADRYDHMYNKGYKMGTPIEKDIEINKNVLEKIDPRMLEALKNTTLYKKYGFALYGDCLRDLLANDEPDEIQILIMRNMENNDGHIDNFIRELNLFLGKNVENQDRQLGYHYCNSGHRADRHNGKLIKYENYKPICITTSEPSYSMYCNILCYDIKNEEIYICYSTTQHCNVFDDKLSLECIRKKLIKFPHNFYFGLCTYPYASNPTYLIKKGYSAYKNLESVDSP